MAKGTVVGDFIDFIKDPTAGLREQMGGAARTVSQATSQVGTMVKDEQKRAQDNSPQNVAIREQLSEQSQRFSASTLLTGGQGVLDRPTTASRTLLGI